MDIRYINPFMSAVQHVFKTMLSVDADIGKPQAKKEVCRHTDVAAIMGYSGAATGTIATLDGIPYRARPAGRFTWHKPAT